MARFLLLSIRHAVYRTGVPLSSGLVATTVGQSRATEAIALTYRQRRTLERRFRQSGYLKNWCSQGEPHAAQTSCFAMSPTNDNNVIEGRSPGV